MLSSFEPNLFKDSSSKWNLDSIFIKFLYLKIIIIKIFRKKKKKFWVLILILKFWTLILSTFLYKEWNLCFPDSFLSIRKIWVNALKISYYIRKWTRINIFFKLPRLKLVNEFTCKILYLIIIFFHLKLINLLIWLLLIESIMSLIFCKFIILEVN